MLESTCGECDFSGIISSQYDPLTFRTGVRVAGRSALKYYDPLTFRTDESGWRDDGPQHTGNVTYSTMGADEMAGAEVAVLNNFWGCSVCMCAVCLVVFL